MTTWALGYAGKTGMRVRTSEGALIKIAAVTVGNMRAPDPDDLKEKVFDKLAEGDIVLSPSGSNYTYLAAAANRGAKVYWIHPPKIADVRDVPGVLLERFAEKPDDFYEYRSQDAGVAALRSLTLTWLSVQRERVAVANAFSQRMRREQDFARLHGAPLKTAWVEREVASELQRIVRSLGAIRLPTGETDEVTGKQKTRKVEGAQLEAEQRAVLRTKLEQKYGLLYDRYFDPEGKYKPKDRERARKELVDLRLELTGLVEDEDQTARSVEEMLATVPENKLFDGLVSEGATRTRAQVLAFMRNPRLYPVFAALVAYAGLGLADGQARKARQGEPDAGVREFRRALVFDFGAFIWKNDTVGFFRKLYLTYKRYQYLKYWDLMALTLEVFVALGKRPDEGEVGEDNEESTRTEEIGAEVSDAARVDACVKRLIALRDLGRDKGPDLIWRSTPMLRAIEELEREENAERRTQLLWMIFSRSGEVRVGRETRRGLNLQMTGKRVENQIYRMLGRTLLQAIYYRWLGIVGHALPLAEDFLFVRQWRKVTGAAADALPTDYDHEVVRQYFQVEGDRFAAEREAAGTLPPPEVMAKFLPKVETAGEVE